MPLSMDMHDFTWNHKTFLIACVGHFKPGRLFNGKNDSSNRGAVLRQRRCFSKTFQRQGSIYQGLDPTVAPHCDNFPFKFDSLFGISLTELPEVDADQRGALDNAEIGLQGGNVAASETNHQMPTTPAQGAESGVRSSVANRIKYDIHAARPRK